MNETWAIFLLVLVLHVVAEDRCFIISLSPNKKDQCTITALSGAPKCGTYEHRIGDKLSCRDSPEVPSFSCICDSEAAECPNSTPAILAMFEERIGIFEMAYNDYDHLLYPCVATAEVKFPDGEPLQEMLIEPSEPAELRLPSSPSSSNGLSTSSPSSSSAVPESSPSDQNTAEEASTSERPISSTTSATTVVESRTEDDGSDEITTSPRYQSTRIVDNTYSTVPFSTMPTGSKPEVDDKASDYTWIYFVVGLILALVALSTIGGGLYCKLRKKPTVATKPKEEKKANQRQAEGTVATPAEVRIEIPAERPSIPVKDTAPPLPDTAPINQSLTGTTGPMGSPNEDDLNTAGSTITECEISISTTMTEETTGGSGTSGL